uniref:Uncharacterized protein n=1 Tax=Oryza brachyantha TaxID=4533 RepID=J3LRY4_ORYBR
MNPSMHLSSCSLSATISCSLRALAANVFPSSSTTTARTAPATPLRSNDPSAWFLGTATPTFLPSRNCAFGPWSLAIGSMISGCPNWSPSTAEPHPQCVKNAHTAACASMLTWGAHRVMTSPRSPVRSTNPSGRMLSPWSTPAGFLRAQTKRVPARSSP